MTDRFPGRVGIVQRVVAEYRAPFFEVLAKRCEGGVSVFAGEPEPQEGIHSASALDGITYWRATNKYLGHALSPWGMTWQFGLKRWLRHWRPDVLIFENNPRLLSHWPAIALARLSHRPVIGWGLGEMRRTGGRVGTWVRGQAARTIARRFDALLAYSTKGATDYARFGVARERIFIAYNSVSTAAASRLTAQLAQDPAFRTQLRSELFPRSYRTIVVTVGRLTLHKHFDRLLRACADLGNICALVIAGDGPARPELEALARELGVLCHFAGHVTGEALGRLLVASDVFVLPGPGGLAIQEAMAHGLPIIATTADGSEEDLVIEGRNGFLLRSAAPAELARVLRMLTDNPELRRQMGRDSRLRTETVVNLDCMADVFVSALRYVSACQQ